MARDVITCIDCGWEHRTYVACDRTPFGCGREHWGPESEANCPDRDQH